MNPSQAGPSSMSLGPAQQQQHLQAQLINALFANPSLLSSLTNQSHNSVLSIPTVSSIAQHTQSVPEQNTQQLPQILQPQAIPQQPSSLSWPVSSFPPLVQVPFFDPIQYRNVNTVDVSPSADPSGMDLPLNDIVTLRFYFNIGVQIAKQVLTSQVLKDQQGQVINSIPTAQSIQNQQVLKGNTVPNQLANLNILTGAPNIPNVGLEQLHALGVLPSVFRQLQPQPAQQQHHQLLQAQMLAAARNSSQVTIGNQPNDLNVFGQAGNLLVRQQQAQSGNPSALSSHSSSAKNSITGSAPDQVLLHQALIAVSRTSPKPSTSLHEVRIQQLLQQQQQAQQAQAQQAQQVQQAQQAQQAQHHQQHLQQLQSNSTQYPVGISGDGLMRTMDVANVVKPMAVGGGSGEAAISPRPPIPIDPSPPRNIETTRHQQAQTSPPASSQNESMRPKEVVVGVNRSKLIDVASSKDGPLASTSRAPFAAQTISSAYGGDDSNTPSHLFQISERHFTEAFHNRAASNPIGIARNADSKANEDGSRSAPSISIATPSSQTADRQGDGDNRPALAPALMMSFLNSCMRGIKSQLSTNGLPVNVDSHGQPVDFSSRPIDPIFQRARQQLDETREFKDPEKTLKVEATGTPSPSPSRADSQSIEATVPSSTATSSPGPETPDNSAKERKTESLSHDESSDDEPGSKRLRIATEEE
ncbi:unnamed protein product [Auanema sp. JU1783]|nr:unnamed protein product [Auanema sp. JU1783]